MASARATSRKPIGHGNHDLAEEFRAAAALAKEAPAVELGTVRRQAYTVKAQVANAFAGAQTWQMLHRSLNSNR